VILLACVRASALVSGPPGGLTVTAIALIVTALAATFAIAVIINGWYRGMVAWQRAVRTAACS
jgi:hypothetical protein